MSERRLVPFRGGGFDPRQHALDREADVVDGGEHLVVEAVEADRDPAQPGVPERPRLARQRRAVGGHRQVPEPGDPREHLDKPLHLAAHERLAAGQADLLHPMITNKDPREALDLLKRQKLGALEELVVAPEDLAGHAIDATEIATIGDRDPQIAQRPRQRVDDRHHDHSPTPPAPPNRRRLAYVVNRA